MEQPDTWKVPPSLAGEIDEYQAEKGLSRKQAIEELIRLGLTACGECHTRLRYQRAKGARS